MSVVATIRNMPTNYTDNMELHFFDLESAIRSIRKKDTIFVALKENDIWHKVPLDKNGKVAIGTYSYSAPSGGTNYRSKLFDEIVEKINQEESTPKLG